VEEGEHPEEALRRELWEELGVQVAVEEPLTFAWHRDEVKTVLLLFYRAAIREGSPCGREGQEVGWFTRQQLRDLPVPPADRHLVRLLVGE
jgi:8-oxo-dGTP diphosphatase